MAVQFISDLSTTKVLNAFNNNEVRFKSTSGEIAISATILINGASVTITPAPGGIFTFNFKEVFKILTNKNHFQDGIYTGLFIPGPASYVKKDNDVYKKMTVNYKIELEDGTFDETDRIYKALRSVVQLEDYRRNQTNEDNSVLALLSPMAIDSNKTFHATLFNGYPYDVAVYLNDFKNVTVKNKTTNFQLTFMGTPGVNRFFFSDGVSNLTLDNVLPLAFGENEIEFSTPAEGSSLHTSTLFLTKKEACQGHLLKWFNNDGGWCYHLFQENKVDGRFKEVADFPNSFGNIKDTRSAFTSMGYEASKTIELYGNLLTSDEKRYINTMFGSPKVYLYLNKPFQKAIEKSFIDVKISGSKAELEKRYLRFYDFFFEIEHPYLNSLTM